MFSPHTFHFVLLFRSYSFLSIFFALYQFGSFSSFFSWRELLLCHRFTAIKRNCFMISIQINFVWMSTFKVNSKNSSKVPNRLIEYSSILRFLVHICMIFDRTHQKKWPQFFHRKRNENGQVRLLIRLNWMHVISFVYLTLCDDVIFQLCFFLVALPLSFANKNAHEPTSQHYSAAQMNPKKNLTKIRKRLPHPAIECYLF